MYQEIHLTNDRSMQEQFDEIGKECGFGPSPGGAAAILGISRQSVYRAITRGALRAYRVYYPGETKDPLVYVDSASLDSYKELRELNGGRIPYRARAI